MEGKYLQQFKKGSLETILLCLIAQKETYGYELLTQLNEQGLVRSRLAKAKANGGTKKYYSLTPKGKETLGKLVAFWEDYAQCVDGFIKSYREAEV